MNDRFNIRYFNKNTKKFEYLKIGAVNFNLFTDWTVYEQGQFCTGLKDKNGKLIYEGDIVRFKNTDNKYYIGTIKYTDEDALFCLSYRNEDNRDDWDYVSRYRLEVIGNIYENKELLESEG